MAAVTDVIFICVRPGDIKMILNEIKSVIRTDTLLVSLNGSVTAEINQSQTLVCYNQLIQEEDKNLLVSLLKCMGNVIELPEHEMGIGSELVSCMLGFIAAIFDVISKSARMHTEISDTQIVDMLLRTMVGTGNLMLDKQMNFDDVVERVATKGGITEEGTKVIYESFPKLADEMFDKTLEKRRVTTKKAQESFEN